MKHNPTKDGGGFLLRVLGAMGASDSEGIVKEQKPAEEAVQASR